MQNISQTSKLAQVIFDNYTSGQSTSKIADHLNESQIPPTHGRKWTSASVNSILRDESYADKIISRPVWERAQEVNRNSPLLSGLITCGVCGSPYNLMKSIGHYVCQNQRKQGKCGNLYIRAEDLEEAIWQRIEKNRKASMKDNSLRAKDALRLLKTEPEAKREVVRRFVPGITVYPAGEVPRAVVRILSVAKHRKSAVA